MLKGEDIITCSFHHCTQDEARDVFRQN